MPDVLFKCRVCSFTTPAAALAIVCETQGKPDFRFGDRERFTKGNTVICILERFTGQQITGRNFPMHVPMYKIVNSDSSGKNTFVCTQDELIRLIEENK